MALNTTRTPPQRSFGRRPGASPETVAPSRQPTVSFSEPPVSPSAEAPAEIPQDAKPAQNWLSEITGQSRPERSQPATVLQLALPFADDQPAIDNQPRDVQAAGLNALGVVGRSLAVLVRNPVTFLALVAAAALTEQVAGFFLTAVGIPAWMILPVLTTLGCTALYAAAFNAAMSSLKGEKVNFDLGLRSMASTPGSAYGVIAVTVSSLSLLLIIPAIGFAWRWVLAAPVAMVEGGDARARSAALGAPHRVQLRFLVLLLAALSILRSLLAMSLSPESILAGLAGDWLFPMLLTVLTAVTGAVLYRDLVPSAAGPSAS
jgi:hypothetical protein